MKLVPTSDHEQKSIIQNKTKKKKISLIPISSQTQARIAVQLKELRNSSVFGFFMINALFVLIVFLLQLNKDHIHIKWPLGVRTNVTYDEATQEVTYWDTTSYGHSLSRLRLTVCGFGVPFKFMLLIFFFFFCFRFFFLFFFICWTTNRKKYTLKNP